MDEMYRMLGREHEADLEREASKWRRAGEARSGPRETGVKRHRLRKPMQLVVARVAGFVGRAARVEA